MELNLRKFKIDGVNYHVNGTRPERADSMWVSGAHIHVTEVYNPPRGFNQRWELIILGLREKDHERITSRYKTAVYNSFEGVGDDGKTYSGMMWCNSYDSVARPSITLLWGRGELKEVKPAMDERREPPVPAPARPTWANVGDRIKTDICPPDRKWDIQILAILLVKDGTNGAVITTNVQQVNILPGAKKNAPGTRTFIVWEQHMPMGSSEVFVHERLKFAEELNQHAFTIFKEPTAEDLQKRIRDVLYNGNEIPPMVFVSSEAFNILDGSDPTVPKPKKMYYDHIPLIEVDVPGIRIFAPGDGWKA